MSKVVHLSSLSHARAKAYCRLHSLRMSEWVGGLIETACRQAGIEEAATGSDARERVGKKSLPPMPSAPSAGEGTPPSYAAPPFWAEKSA